MRTRQLVPVLLLIAFVSSCSKDEISDLEIITGRVCGWCAPSDSLVLTHENTLYKQTDPCSKEILFQSTITNYEWDELVDLFDWNAFKKIDINTCNVCVDGCDNYIDIKKGLSKHRITFGGPDTPELETIRPFVVKLEEILDSYRPDRTIK